MSTGPVMRNAGLLGRLMVLACFPLAAQVAAQVPWEEFSGRFSASPENGAPPGPWQALGFPVGRKPRPRFDLVQVDGVRVLRVRSEQADGTLVHHLTPAVPSASSVLRWRWRIDQPVAGADLREKNTDDSPLKVCALFDMPLERLGFMERNLLRMARARLQQPLPAATLCYVWDAHLPVGTILPNVYSPRVRYMVLNSGAQAVGQWHSHERPLAQDFMLAFGHESPVVPPLEAIAIGADSDNTHGSSQALVGDMGLTR